MSSLLFTPLTFFILVFQQLALYVLSFLEPKDLLQAAQTCRYWRILAEDNLLWREKCKEEGESQVCVEHVQSERSASTLWSYPFKINFYILGWKKKKSLLVQSASVSPLTGIDEPLPLKKRKIVKPGFTHSPWKSAYIRQHRIDTNWRRGDLKSPKVAFPSNLNSPQDGLNPADVTDLISKDFESQNGGSIRV